MLKLELFDTASDCKHSSLVSTTMQLWRPAIYRAVPICSDWLTDWLHRELQYLSGHADSEDTDAARMNYRRHHSCLLQQLFVLCWSRTFLQRLDSNRNLHVFTFGNPHTLHTIDIDIASRRHSSVGSTLQIYTVYTVFKTHLPHQLLQVYMGDQPNLE